MRKHRFFIITFTLAVIIFFWKIILLRSAFLGGDYIDQFYPWSRIYADAVKAFHFPYWTRYVQGGFPLMAEGQIGGFYPFNILLYFTLPFIAAYNYAAVLHFCLAGIFTYMFSKKLGACEWGGTLSALLFCFGSAYAGCYINTATVKVLAWFPLVLLIYEIYFSKKNPVLPLLGGMILGIQLLAGSTQVAVYTCVFYFIYYFYGIYLRNGRIKRADVYNFAMMMFVSASIFMPQFILSKTIAGLSWRKNATMGFAMWGSFSPVSLMSSVIPYPFFRGARFYLSVFSFPFLILGVLKSRSSKMLRPITILLFTGVFLAFGKNNPLYVLLIKITHLYDFRNPSKFLLFGLFAGSVLCGVGMSSFFSREKENVPLRKALLFSVIWVSTVSVVFFAGRSILLNFRANIIHIGRILVEKFVYGKGFHRYSLDTYYQKVENIVNSYISISGINEPLVLTSVILASVAVVIWLCLLKYDRVGHVKVMKGVFLCLIFADLSIFSSYGTGFRGNISGFDALEPEQPRILSIVLKDNTLFRILPYGIASDKLPNWTIPSANALYGLDNVALYTPLANESFSRRLAPLEVIDTALGLKLPEEDSLDKCLDDMRLLNVKYIISYKELNKSFLEYTADENGIFLYRLREFLPRVFFTKTIKPGSIDGRAVRIEVGEYRSGYMHCRVNVPVGGGYVVFSENNYPGWTATVDGEKRPVIPISLVQAVYVEKGYHEIIFSYHPFRKAG